uniref:Protocadherin 2 alpha c n=1 Tax=Nothobranchius rachovii TaxID=451742 RepID=A0A1A8RZ41_9TELE
MEQRGLEKRMVTGRFTRCALAVLLWSVASAQLRYSISEEVNEGAVVGNMAKDLGLDKNTLKTRKYRVVSGGADPLFSVNENDGVLYVSRKIDREEVCAQSSVCLIDLKTVLENPLEVHNVGVEVLDINDHAPSFPEKEKTLEVYESVPAGARFQLKPAKDPDSSSFSVQQYKLSQNDHFRLDVKDKGKDGKIPILVLQKPLDREAAQSHSLVLTALDGGKPPKSGQMAIVINVLDVNDNIPMFSNDDYSATLIENAVVGTAVIQVNATDLDEGQNAEVIYSFGHSVSSNVINLFDLNESTGQITVKGPIDYELNDKYDIEIQVSDKGLAPLTAEKNFLIKIVDVNDNAPEIEVTSFSSSIPEDSRPGTTVALISVNDLDSGLNGKVICSINQEVPFSLSPSSQDKMFSLVTKSPLDREKQSHYDLTITAKDAGQPPLSSEKTIRVVVSDVNDNSPEFTLSPYTFYITEGNNPGASVFSVKASDGDEGDNAVISYHIVRDRDEHSKLTSFLNINSETGDIVALRSFDFETVKTFQFQVVASDSGSPSLSSNVTVNVFILDQNDNAPVIVSPVPQQNGTAPSEAVPRSADAGYLITRVNAADADAGQNSRLFYQLLQTTDPSLFSIALYTGEIRTMRQIEDKEPSRHRLVVLVKDNGQPPLSATVSIILSVVDSLPVLQPDLGDLSQTPHHSSNFPFYLIVALGAISFTSLLAIIVLVTVRRQRGRVSSKKSSFPSISGCCRCASTTEMSATTTEVFKKSNLNVRMSSGAPGGAEPSGGGARPQVYCYKMCLTPESSKSDFMFLKPCSQVMAVQQNNAKSTDYLTSGWSALDRRELFNNRATTPNELNYSNKSLTWTKNQRNSAYKRYSSSNMEGTLSRHQKFETDGFSYSVAPQYWTWGNHDYKRPPQDEVVPDYSWTPKYAQPQSEAADYQHNVFIPGTTSGYSTLKLTPRGELDVYNTFSTFGKKNKFISNYEQSFDNDDFMKNSVFK